MFRLTALIISAFILLPGLAVIGIEDNETAFKFIGSQSCKECHGEDAIGNQYKIWASSPHARAYTLLTGEKGAEIAKKLKITSPEKKTECLRCHSTGKGAVSSIVKEGVGCEACHGPGSEYRTASNHVNYESRENGYRRAIKMGMYPILGIESLKTREKLCLSCHRQDRPCFPENRINNYKYIIPIQTIDSLRKGDVNFRHPLLRR